MKKTIILAWTIVLLGSSSAMAQQKWPEEPKMYVSLGAGAVFLDDSTLSNSIGSLEAEFDPGFGILGAIGYDFGITRLELEAAYRSNDFDKLKAGTESAAAGGEMTTLGGMVNLFFDLHNRTRFTPYLGAGIGGMDLDVEDLSVEGLFIGESDDAVFAYQGMVGFDLELTPRFAVDVSYRYFATTDPDFDGVDAEYESHSAMAGFRYLLF